MKGGDVKLTWEGYALGLIIYAWIIIYICFRR